MSHKDMPSWVKATMARIDAECRAISPELRRYIAEVLDATEIDSLTRWPGVSGKGASVELTWSRGTSRYLVVSFQSVGVYCYLMDWGCKLDSPKVRHVRASHAQKLRELFWETGIRDHRKFSDVS